MCARNSPRISSKRPLLCYVSDRKTLAGHQKAGSVDLLLQKLDEVIAAGIDWVQIREKDLSARELSRVVRSALRSVDKYSSGRNSPRILVNDRLDVALAEGASGVHLGENSLPVTDTKELVRSVAAAPIEVPATKRTAPNDFLIGASCHRREDAEAAAASGADYIFFGPIFATPSKAAYGAPQGLDRLAEVCRTVSIPVIAIGGITADTAESCLRGGATGIAAIRLFQGATDVAQIVKSIQLLRSQG